MPERYGPLQAYLTQRDANQKAGLVDTQNAQGLMQILAQGQQMQTQQHNQAQIDQFRNEIATAKTPDEQLAVASKYMAPGDLGTMIQTAKTRQTQQQNTLQLGMLRLSQQAQKHLDDLMVKRDQTTDRREKEYWDRKIDEATLYFKKRADEMQQGRYDFEVGGPPIARYQGVIPDPNAPMGTTPSAPVAPGPGVTNIQPGALGGDMSGSQNPLALIQRISDPSERAAAMLAYQQQLGQSGASAAAAAPPVAAAPAAPADPFANVAGGGATTAPDPFANVGGGGGSTAAAPARSQPGRIAISDVVTPATAPKPLSLADAPAGLTPRGKQEWLQTQERIRASAAVKADVNLMGGRESAQIQRVLTAANQATKDLTNIVELPIGATSRGIVGGRTQGKSLFEAGKETLTQHMTTQEVATYNAAATGLVRQIAAIETMGVGAPTNALMHMMDNVIIKEGESHLTKMLKLAQTRQIVDSALETLVTNPRVSEEQKKHASDIMSEVAKAIPFKFRDVLKFEQGLETNPNLTLREAMAQGGAAATGGFSAEQERRYQELLKKRQGK